MFADPIVEEVRNAGRELAEEADGDLRKFFANLRQAQEKYRDRLVSEVAPASDRDLPRPSGNSPREMNADLDRPCGIAD
ncbi:MAG: hypothetical protein AB1646_19870 [Thermodesulfobacteriota bacterium]